MNLTKSAGVIGAATMTSRVLGLVRDQVMAFFFGAGDQMDAYNVAFRLPNLVRDLFAEGAMSAAFVPTFTRALATNDRQTAWRLGSLVVNVLVLATGAVVVVGMVFAGSIVTAFAGSYARVPGKLELTVSLARVMFPFLTMVAVAAVLMGMLNSLHRFFVPALSPAAFNVGSILCTVGLLPVMPMLGLPAIMAPAIGVLVGGLGQVVVQWPALRREGYRYQPALDFSDDGLRQILVLMGPGVAGLAAVQVNILVTTFLAAHEGTGAVSWLSYGFRTMYMPIGLFGVSIATAALPTLSRHAARRDQPEMQRTISHGLRLMLMLNVPATVGLVVLSDAIIGLIFEHGRFTASDTAATAAALACYAPGLIGYSVVKIAAPSFYAQRDSRTPVLVSVLTVAVNLALSLTLVRVMGFKGLALSTALAALFNAGVLLWILRGRLGGLDGRRIAISLGKIAVASVLMGLAAWAADASFVGHWPSRAPAVMGVRVGLAMIAALVVLDLAGRALRLEEAAEIRLAIARQLRPLARRG
ncbi:MAG: murein biosynthesis integral membrane protein MurJ [Acidobacteriota bacterium]